MTEMSNLFIEQHPILVIDLVVIVMVALSAAAVIAITKWVP